MYYLLINSVADFHFCSTLTQMQVQKFASPYQPRHLMRWVLHKTLSKDFIKCPSDSQQRTARAWESLHTLTRLIQINEHQRVSEKGV